MQYNFISVRKKYIYLHRKQCWYQTNIIASATHSHLKVQIYHFNVTLMG